jgi:hypothetical protein
MGGEPMGTQMEPITTGDRLAAAGGGQADGREVRGWAVAAVRRLLAGLMAKA